jgi:hypothetical protein
MALDLIDFRGKLTAEASALLKAEAHTTGKSEQEILRDYMHEIALRKIQAAKVLVSLAPDEGRSGASGGSAG